MLSPDASSFTRFLVWAGAALCALAFLLPAGVWRDNEVLQISERDLAGYTQVARRELERRQKVSRDLSRASPYVSGALLIAGMGLMACALPRLNKRERADDKRMAAADERFVEETVRLRAGYDRVSAEEQEVSALADEEEHTEPDREPEPADESPPTENAVQPVGIPGRVRRAMRAQAIEERVLLRLQAIVDGRFEFAPRVRLGLSELDALLLTRERERGVDIAVEIKAPSISDRTTWTKWGTSLAGKVQQAASASGRETAGWLIIVLPETAEATSDDLDRLQPGLLVSVLIGESAIDSLELPTGSVTVISGR